MPRARPPLGARRGDSAGAKPGATESLDLAKKILLDCAESVPDTVTVPTLAITKENAADLEKKLKF